MRQEAVPRFGMSIREIFSNWNNLAVINEHDRGDVMEIWTVLGHVYHVACKMEPFRHLSNQIFLVPNLGITKPMRVICFSERSKFEILFNNAAKNWEKVFCFSDNCIWIGIVILSLWRTRYFSSAANVLRRNRKILHVNKRDFFQLNFLWQWS